MKKLDLKKIDYRHYICIGITLLFIGLSLGLYLNHYFRFGEACKDFGLSIAGFFNQMFHLGKDINPSVNDLTKYLDIIDFPETFAKLKIWFQNYFDVFASKSNFYAYLYFLFNLTYKGSYALLFIVPLIIISVVLFKMNFNKQNNDYNVDSKPLFYAKKFSAKIYTPVKKWIISLCNFIKEHRYYLTIWFFIGLFTFNVFTILVEFLAYYFYFCMHFNFDKLYMQFYKLIIDIWPALRDIPLIVWAVIILIALDRFRKKIALSRLSHYELRNRGFINERALVLMACGTMGKKKTTIITDMALSQEVMLRDKAFEKILENDLKFPYFPWINLEMELRNAMYYHQVYNLATVRLFIQKKHFRFNKSNCREKIFDYDYKTYGSTYNDSLSLIDIWEVLETYAQLYFIYVIESSLLISNYSIRTDNILSDLGNFPLWNTDFFSRDSKLIDAYSRHAHILDFDALRLGNKILEHNYKQDSIEFGVINITEIGKERGNNLELKEIKKTDTATNQKNDLFNSWLKMVRHNATVDHFPFVKILADEQRPESWGADARDLCEIVYIEECSDNKLAMPFFTIGELLHSWIYNKFSNLYYDYRYTRSDNTLGMYFLKILTEKMHSYYTKIYNRFGFTVIKVKVEEGTQDGSFKESKYYLMNKKIYSKRFSTDCFSEFFNEKSLRSSIGINDLQEFEKEKANFDEMLSENSYFFNDLIKIKNNEKE